jgi:hypothetical protein
VIAFLLAAQIVSSMRPLTPQEAARIPRASHSPQDMTDYRAWTIEFHPHVVEERRVVPQPAARSEPPAAASPSAELADHPASVGWAPNANAHVERFVRSIKAECLDRIIPIGERHFVALAEYVAHYHDERNHQALGNLLITGRPTMDVTGRIFRRARLGGVLNFYERAA